MQDDARDMPRIGEVLGEFRLLHLAGEGTTSWVYAAEHVDLRRRVAVKVMRPGGDAVRFQQEARIAGWLRHEHIVERAPSEVPDPRWSWYAMELLAGRSLRDQHEWEGPGGAARAVAIAGQIAAALT